MLHKPTYINEIEEQIASWNSELQKFRVIAEVADKDRQIEHYQVIEDITNKQSIVAEKLDEIKESTKVNWEHLASDIEAIRMEVEKAIEAARKTIN